jgi:hypothetical protein
MSIIQNAYYHLGWKYMSSAEASTYSQSGGKHEFRVAASGVADAAVTWITGLFISNTGNVGVGTQLPRTKLHVSGGAIMTDSSNGFAAYGVGLSGDTNTEYLSMYHDGGAGRGVINVVKTGTGTYRPLYIKTGNLDTLVLDASGNASFYNNISTGGSISVAGRVISTLATSTKTCGRIENSWKTTLYKKNR